jgi:ribosomal protein S17E
MPPTYQQNKVHIYKWRQKNTLKVRNSNIKGYIWRKIQKVFLAILQD